MAYYGQKKKLKIGTLYLTISNSTTQKTFEIQSKKTTKKHPYKQNGTFAWQAGNVL